MRFKTLVPVLAVMAALALTVQVVAQQPSPRNGNGSGVEATSRPAVPGVPEGLLTITYDNNIPFARDGQVDAFVGNIFDTGVPASSHTVQSLSFRVAGNYGTGILASIWRPGAGTASLLRRWNISGVPNGLTGTVTGQTLVAPIASAYGGGMPITGNTAPFMAGLHNSFYTALQCATAATAINSTCDGVALTEGVAVSGTPQGVKLQLAGGAFTPTTTMVNTGGVALNSNAIMRAILDVVPVELMSFEIE